MAKRVLFCLQEFLDAFPSDILVSLSLGLPRPIRGEAEASRGGHGLEGGAVDVYKLTLSKQSQSKLGLISVFKLALTQTPNTGLGSRHLRRLHQQCVSHLSSFGGMKLIRAYVSLYVCTHFVLPFVPADLIKSGSYGR